MLGLCPCLGRSYNDEQMQKKRAKSRKRRRRRRVLRERGNWPGSSSSTTSRHFWLALMMMTFSTTMALASEPIRGEQTTWIFLSQTCLPSWTIQSADQMVSAAQTGRTLGKTSEGGAAATAVGGYRASDRISRGRDTLINETYPLSPASSRPFCLFFRLYVLYLIIRRFLRLHLQFFLLCWLGIIRKWLHAIYPPKMELASFPAL